MEEKTTLVFLHFNRPVLSSREKLGIFLTENYPQIPLKGNPMVLVGSLKETSYGQYFEEETSEIFESFKKKEHERLTNEIKQCKEELRANPTGPSNKSLRMIISNLIERIEELPRLISTPTSEVFNVLSFTYEGESEEVEVLIPSIVSEFVEELSKENKEIQLIRLEIINSHKKSMALTN